MGVLILLLVSLSLMFFGAYYACGRDIMAPAVVMTGMFVITTSFAMVSIEEWNVEYRMELAFIVLSGIIVFIVANALFRLAFLKTSPDRGKLNQAHELDIQPLVLVLLIVFDIVACYYYFKAIQAIVGKSHLSYSNIFSLYRRMGIQHTAGKGAETVSGIAGQMIKVVKASGFCAAYALIRNLVGQKGKLFTNGCLVALTLISCVPTVMIAGRTGILQLISAMLIMTYIVWNQRNSWKKGIPAKYLRSGIVTIAIGVPAFYYSIRLLGRSTKMSFFEYISFYIGGSLAFFNEYLKRPKAVSCFGEESLYGLNKVLNFFGMGVENHAYNLEFRSLSGLKGNVYTFFRRPYHDFGLLGMYIFVILVALLFSYIYYSKIYRQSLYEGIHYWTLIYAYLYYWIIASSIMQYSVSYISVGTCAIISLILVLYFIITKVKILL